MCMHTSGRATATQYSGVKELAPLPMILELEVGSVDRGASIRDFSQYPYEDEYLFVPLCFVAPAGPQRMEVTDKSVLHITPVRDARVGAALPSHFQASFHLQLSFAVSLLLGSCLFRDHSGLPACTGPGLRLTPWSSSRPLSAQRWPCTIDKRRKHLRIRCLNVQARVQRAV
jgi:hypothetical protein